MIEPRIYKGDGWTIVNSRWQDSTPDVVDVVISDPPYSEHVHSKQWIGAALTKGGDKRCSTAFTELGFDAITDEGKAEAILGASVARRWILLFSDIEGIGGWRRPILAAGLDYVRACVWDKVDGAPQFSGDRPAAAAELIICAHRKGKKHWNGGGRRGLFRHPVNGERGSKPHPSTKPVALMLDLVRLFSDPGELVWDPYCGSGTTGVACLRLGREFIGHEMQPRPLASKRLPDGRTVWLEHPHDKPYARIAAERLRAEKRCLTLQADRRGQTSIFDAMEDR